MVKPFNNYQRSVWRAKRSRITDLSFFIDNLLCILPSNCHKVRSMYEFGQALDSMVKALGEYPAEDSGLEALAVAASRQHGAAPATSSKPVPGSSKLDPIVVDDDDEPVQEPKTPQTTGEATTPPPVKIARRLGQQQHPRRYPGRRRVYASDPPDFAALWDE